MPSDIIEELDERLLAAMRAYRVPGVTCGLLHAGQTYTLCHGVTSLDNPLPVTADTLFQIGSITKTVVGTAVMRLVEQGRLHLDMPVRTYLPGLIMKDEVAAATVTMRMLLAHTGGWAGDYFNTFGWGDDALPKMVEAMAGLPQLTRPGALFHYNNAGFYLAGRVIEVVTGRPFEAALRELVFGPLGLVNTWFFPEDVMVRRFSVGHTATFDETPTRVIPIWPIGRAANPAGGIASSVNDLLTYARLHLGLAGPQVISAESIAAMQQPVISPCGSADAWGLSWALYDYGGRMVIAHGGETSGFIAQFMASPRDGLAFVLLTNSSRGRELTAEIGPHILKTCAGLEKPPPIYIDPDPKALTERAGIYDSQLSEVRLWLEGRALMFQQIPLGHFPTPDTPPLKAAPPPSPLRFVDPDKAVVQEGAAKGTVLEFMRDDSGRLVWLRSGGRLHRPRM